MLPLSETNKQWIWGKRRQYFTSILLLIFFKSNSPDGKAGLFMPSLPQKLSVCQYCRDWLAWVWEMLLINYVSANEYQVRGDDLMAAHSPCPCPMVRVTARLKQFNNLELSPSFDPRHRARLGVRHAPPIPVLYFPCCDISPALLKPQTQRYTRRRERATLLCYYIRPYIPQLNAWNSCP